MDIDLPLLEWFKTLVCAGLFGLVIILIKNNFHASLFVEVPITLAAGFLVYGVSILVLNIVNLEEIKKLLKTALKK